MWYLSTTKNEMIYPKKGDIIEISEGGMNKKFTFIEGKRTKWVGKDESGKNWLIRATTKVVGIVGKDESVLKDVIKPNDKLKVGDLFSIQGKGETFMFKSNKTDRKIVAVNIANLKIYTIDVEGFTFNKVNLKEIEKSL